MSDSESGSDIEIARPNAKIIMKKLPRSPDEHLKREPKKLTVKDMIHGALKELNTRKGVSLHAIKKYMVERYSVDTDKINYHIKKYIKTGVESGALVQTKGIGASGSFKLAPNQKMEKKKKKMVKIVKSDKIDKEKNEKIKKKSESSENKASKISKKTEDKKIKKKESTKTKTTKDKEKRVKIAKESKMTKEGNLVKATKISKTTKTAKNSKMASETPAKKRSIMIKRKSIGSIIKPPKMKPKKRD